MKRSIAIILALFSPLGLLAQEFQPVTNLRYEVQDSNKARFDWDFPEDYIPHEQELSWSDCEYYTLIGSATHINWPCAHRFDTDDLQNYVGWRIKTIAFMPTQDRTDYSIRIWKGEEAPELCYDSPVGNDTICFQMNYYPVTENIYIEEGKQLWIGFNAEDPYGRWPWAVDAGPAVIGKGDLMWMDGGFVSMGEMGMNYNFCIRAYIESPEGEQKVIGWETRPTENEVITGYNLYIDGQLVKEIHGEYPLYYEYWCINDWNMEFAVKALYGNQEAESVSINTVWPDDNRWYWKIITQPAGYEIDTIGNVTISTAEGLAWLISTANGYNCQQRSDFLGKTISITNDIDLSEHEWTSLGLGFAWYNYFRGTVEGNGHTISGMHVSDQNGCGFFQGFRGAMRDLNFNGCEITNYSKPIGCLASSSEQGTFINCHVTVTTINGSSNCGGLLGNESYPTTMRNCSFTDGEIGITTQGCGGLIGCANWITAENCYFVGTLTDISGDATKMGGIAGYESSTREVNIRNCYAVLLDSNAPEKVAGIINNLESTGTVSNCYSIISPEICFDNQGMIENSAMFDGSGTFWTLTEPVMVGGLQTDDLLTALDHWVTDQTAPDTYFHWVEDTQMTNSGLPIFGELYDGLEDLSNDFGTIIYPNPTTGLLSITTDDFGHAEIYDLTGRLMKQSKQTTIDLGRLPQGLYVVKIFDHSGNSIIRKVIKQ